MTKNEIKRFRKLSKETLIELKKYIELIDKHNINVELNVIEDLVNTTSNIIKDLKYQSLLDRKNLIKKMIDKFVLSEKVIIDNSIRKNLRDS